MMRRRRAWEGASSNSQKCSRAHRSALRLPAGSLFRPVRGIVRAIRVWFLSAASRTDRHGVCAQAYQLADHQGSPEAVADALV